MQQHPTATLGGDIPRADDLSRCVHCGLCLMSCPTFVVTGLEPESPRGRIALIKAASEGRIALNDTVLPHLDQCLQCRNCEAVCPSGVPYGRIMEGARAQIVGQRLEPPVRRVVRTAILRGLLPHRRRLETVAAGLRWYRRSGAQAVFRRAARLGVVPRRLAELEALAPNLPDRAFRPPAHRVIATAAVATSSRNAGQSGTGADSALHDRSAAVEAPADSERMTPQPSVGTRRVAFFTGCVMPLMYPATHEATLRVLARNGVAALAPPAPTCCGALMVHSGDRDGARVLARAVVDRYLDLGVEAVIVNAAGCGSTLKEYHELLSGDPAYAAKAQQFSALVRDVTEYVAALPFADGLGAVHARVTYQDSCHLAHAQRIKAPPRRIIRAIPGVQFVDMPNADRCCGSAGIFNIVQPEMSMQVLAAKMDEVEAAAPDIVVTANPGCMAQLEAGLRRRGLRARVMHVMDLLDLAYRSGA